MRGIASFVLCSMLVAGTAAAEVVRVTIDGVAPVADGRVFGAAGAYERLSGTIEFALDPAHPRNKAIVDLERAARGADGRVHFTSTLYVIRPVDASRGNGTLLFEISNRGGKGLMAAFNGGTQGPDPRDVAAVGDGYLMREGYTLVTVGWEFDVAPGLARVEAPRVQAPADRAITVEFIRDAAAPAVTLDREAPLYVPAALDQRDATLTVRDTYWAAADTIPREQWRFVPSAAAPALAMDGGFAPGRTYAVTYRTPATWVAGVGLAAVRDAASAFRYRRDLPVQGRRAVVVGVSQSGRFLRQFLADGFNADEADRRAFDGVWAHVAGAALGSFNETLAMPRHLAPFNATRPPFALEQADGRDGLLTRYRADQRPKIFFTNSPVEYWGNGRAAALTHTSINGLRDLPIPEEARIYLYAGTQHGGQGPLPPHRGNGQQFDNPTPQQPLTRALLRAMNEWVTRGTPPPPSRYPRLSDRTLIPVSHMRFPALAGVGDPRRIVGPALIGASGALPLPFLVPQVDGDGNETSGLRVPDQAVPLGTVTGWNFRASAVGNPSDVYPLLGSYIPFAVTRAARDASGDPRRSIEERYPSRGTYLQRIRDVAERLIKDRYLLAEDLASIVAHAERHWTIATGGADPR